MNFDPVGVDSKGQMYMKFHKPFNVVEKIQLLQRWILVQSFAYYELNSNIASDFDYDANAMQLTDLMKRYPEESKRSRYYDYFYDYCGDDSVHYTSGFDLMKRVQQNDENLYSRMRNDAMMALRLKHEYSGDECK